MRIIQYSQIAERITCGYRWHARYVRGLEPAAPIYPRDLGTVAHLIFAQKLLNNDPEIEFGKWRETTYNYLKSLEMPVEEFKILKDEFNDVCAVAPQLASRAMEVIRDLKLSVFHWPTDSVQTDRNGALLAGRPMVEIPLWVVPNVKFGQGVNTFHFTPDALLIDSYGSVSVWDLKNRKTLTSLDYESLNLQKAMYQYGLAAMGVETIGSGILQILAKAPQPVKINKDGTPSRANQMTSGAKYREILDNLELNHEAYADILSKLDRREWFRTNFVYRSRSELENIWEKVVIPQSMRTDTIRSLGSFACNMCWMREFCLAEMRGEDGDMSTFKHEEEVEIGTPDAGEGQN